MVGFDKHTEHGDGYREARILLETCHFPYIQGSVYLSVNGVRHDIYVKELGKDVKGEVFHDAPEASNAQKHLQFREENEDEMSPTGKGRNIPAGCDHQEEPNLNDCSNNCLDSGASKPIDFLGGGVSDGDFIGSSPNNANGQEEGRPAPQVG